MDDLGSFSVGFLWDDVRFIDWCYYARMEKLLLRMFHEHSEAPVVVLMDASGSMVAGGRTDLSGSVQTLLPALERGERLSVHVDEDILTG